MREVWRLTWAVEGAAAVVEFLVLGRKLFIIWLSYEAFERSDFLLFVCFICGVVSLTTRFILFAVTRLRGFYKGNAL